MKIKIQTPSSVKEMTPAQLSEWAILVNSVNDYAKAVKNWKFKIQAVSIFSDSHKNDILRAPAQTVETIFKDLLYLLATYERTEPSGTVTISGVTYEFKKDFRKISTAQMVDLKTIEDLDKYPERGLVQCYIEKGGRYTDTDKDGTMKYPTDKRREAFKNFPGDEFLNWLGFFLDKYENKKIALYILATARSMKTLQEIQDELKAEAQTIVATPNQTTT